MQPARSSPDIYPCAHTRSEKTVYVCGSEKREYIYIAHLLSLSHSLSQIEDGIRNGRRIIIHLGARSPFPAIKLLHAYPSLELLLVSLSALATAFRLRILY